MRTTAARWIGRIASLLWIVLSACGGDAPDDSATADPSDRSLPRPHLLVITLDTLRVDALGCYGAVTPTPHLDALAMRGARFTQARTVAPLTLPAHASAFTGRFPFELGVRDNGGFVVPDSASTLAELLTEAGYECGAAVAAPVLAERYGLAQGFTTYLDPVQEDAPTLAPLGYAPAERMVSRATRWLQSRDPKAPFFLWVHLFDAHRPLRPPEADLLAEFGSPAAAATLEPVERELGLYRAEVRALDREVGKLLDAAQNAAGEEPLVVMAVADHGEGNGDHGELAHGYFLYDTTVRIPWIVTGPGVEPETVVDTPVSLVDLRSTALALLGQPPDADSGCSLVPLLRGESEMHTDRPLYFETCYGYTNHRWESAVRTVRAGLRQADRRSGAGVVRRRSGCDRGGREVRRRSARGPTAARTVATTGVADLPVVAPCHQRRRTSTVDRARLPGRDRHRGARSRLLPPRHDRPRASLRPRQAGRDPTPRRGLHRTSSRRPSHGHREHAKSGGAGPREPPLSGTDRGISHGSRGARRSAHVGSNEPAPSHRTWRPRGRIGRVHWKHCAGWTRPSTVWRRRSPTIRRSPNRGWISAACWRSTAAIERPRSHWLESALERLPRADPMYDAVVAKLRELRAKE